MLPEPIVTVLGKDPVHRRHFINGYAFQQDAITSFNGWQYAAFYSSKSEEEREPLFVHLARRQWDKPNWEVIVFDDYPQTTDDGHNTIQLGICAGDGTIHLSYDHHCDVLRYRHSIPSIATSPTSVSWSSSLFTTTLSYLPGLPVSHTHFGYVTYPRFIPAGQDLLLSFRTGKAGLGDDLLYHYRPPTSEGTSSTSTTTSSLSNSNPWSFIGAHIRGVWNNPYVHGLDYRNSKLHTSWVWRGWVDYPGWDDPADTKHKMQAGPNGAENNYNVCYAFSDDMGRTWRNSAGEVIADLGEDGEGNAITSQSKGVTVFEIAKGSELINQEPQTMDAEGRVFVLNRDNVGGAGKTWWKIYWRDIDGTWRQQRIKPDPSRRGRVAVTESGDLLILLPDEEKKSLSIWSGTKDSKFSKFEEIWHGEGFSAEPLVDIPRLETQNVLSVLTLRDSDKGSRDVVVMDFALGTVA